MFRYIQLLLALVLIVCKYSGENIPRCMVSDADCRMGNTCQVTIKSFETAYFAAGILTVVVPNKCRMQLMFGKSQTPILLKAGIYDRLHFEFPGKGQETVALCLCE